MEQQPAGQLVTIQLTNGVEYDEEDRARKRDVTPNPPRIDTEAAERALSSAVKEVKAEEEAEPEASTTSLGEIERSYPWVPYYKDLAEVDKSYVGFSKAQICYYKLVLCYMCGRMVDGRTPPPIGEGRARIYLRSRLSDPLVEPYLYHDRHRSRACLEVIAGGERVYGAACSEVCALTLRHREICIEYEERRVAHRRRWLAEEVRRTAEAERRARVAAQHRRIQL